MLSSLNNVSFGLRLLQIKNVEDEYLDQCCPVEISVMRFYVCTVKRDSHLPPVAIGHLCDWVTEFLIFNFFSQ